MSANNHWRPLLWLLGLGTLAAGVAGAGWAFKDSPGGDPPPAARGSAVIGFGRVDVEHGVRSLAFLQPGRVEEVPVKENATVTRGTVLMRLDDRQAASRLREAEADRADALGQLAEAEKLPRQHQEQLCRQRESVAAAEHALESARHRWEHSKWSVKNRVLPQREADAAGEQVKQLEAQVRAEQARLRELEQVNPEDAVRRARSRVAAKQAQEEQARRQWEEFTLRAPEDGTVLEILAGPGEVVGPLPRQPVVRFCPAGPRFVRLEVEQEFAGRDQLRADLDAEVQDDSSDGPVWMGKVTRVADWYTHRRQPLQEPLQLNDVRTLECIVHLNPGQPPLRVHQRVRVTIRPD
jgi:multidrug resistance efflux pump